MGSDPLSKLETRIYCHLKDAKGSGLGSIDGPFLVGSCESGARNLNRPIDVMADGSLP